MKIPDVWMDSRLRWWFVEWTERMTARCPEYVDNVGMGSDCVIGWGARMIGPVRVDYEFASEQPRGGFFSVVAWARVALLGVMVHVQLEAFDKEDVSYAPIYASYIDVGRSHGIYER